MNKSSGLRAFAVMEEGEGTGGIVFANSGIAARRIGANAYADGDFGYVSCRRAPWADGYAENDDVPVSAMVEAGWHFECGGCGARIDSDMLWERDLELSDVVGSQRSMAYCNPVCEARYALDRAEANHRQKRWIRRFAAVIRRRFPDAKIVPGIGVGGGSYAYASQHRGRWRIEQVAVSFEFPGMEIGPAVLRYNRSDGDLRIRRGDAPGRPAKPHYTCCNGDVKAFEEYARRTRVARESEQ